MQVERAAVAIRLARGERVSNTWATCPRVRNNPPKGGLIPHHIPVAQVVGIKVHLWWTPGEGPAADQLVGEVMAHQGCDR
jgi:hypothetical protein